jgi:hypothetical protein
MDEELRQEIRELKELVKKQTEILDNISKLFEKYDDEYLKEVERDGVAKQE